MKSIYKIFLLALGVYTSAFSQITEITRLPVQDNSQSIKESASSLFTKVKTILNEFKRADRYEIQFSAKGGSASGGSSAGLASGVYIYQLKVNDFITSKKMILIK